VPDFVCRVATSTGEILERTYHAEDETALRHDLENQDLLVLNLRPTNSLVDQLARAFRLRGKVSSRDFLAFNKEFVALIRAGLPILSSLEILTERRKNPAFRRVLVDIRERVKGGEALSDAFTAHGAMFPRLYAASLASGERSGELGSVVARYVDYSSRLLQIQRKVVSALIYPAILLTLSTGLITLMMFVIIPKFSAFLSDFNQDLPLLTRIVVGFAVLCRSNWHLAILGLVTGVSTLVLWTRTPAGRSWLDAFKLRVPLVGRVIGDYAQNRFTRTLATLQAGGIPLVTSIELAGGAVGNVIYERSLAEVANRVREGSSLWESLDQTKLMSDITIQMVKVGESTGALVEMLNHASDFTDEEIDTRLSRIVTLIEPLMLVFMAVIIAVMLLSIYLPLIRVYGSAV
jgi:type IV pilus assembly protein PilC